MTGDGFDGHIDRLVKARWLAMGLSQTDLADVLNAAFQQTQTDGDGVDADRLMQIAEAIDIPVGLFHGRAVKTRQMEADATSDEMPGSLQSLLELRLLRAFCELRDFRTKLTLVHLAEQIVKRQANDRGEAG